MSDNKLDNLLKKYIFKLEKVLNYSKNTIISYKRDLETFIIYCNKMHVEDISLVDEKIIERSIIYHINLSLIVHDFPSFFKARFRD